MMVLFITALMGIGLASYLTLVRYQNLSVMRSLSWNTGIPMIEAGIEEAMTHINRSGITNLNSAGWTLSDGWYWKTRQLGDNYYQVKISTSDPPVIRSDSYTRLPLTSVAPVAFIAAYGFETDATSFTKRRVRVTCRKDGMWTHAMVARGQIDLLGNNVASDSFDSANPNYSTGGQYDVTKRRDHGDIATNSGIVNSLNVANADLWGRASTGPGGSVAIGPNGSVGDLAWHLTYKKGIEPGWTNNDMNVYFRDVTRPYNSGYPLTSGTIGTTTYKYLLTGTSPGSGDYMTTDLSMQGNEVMYVAGNCKLLVTGTINISGNAYIQIAPGASLQLYMEGANASLGGNGIANQTGYAINFLYFGLPTNTSLSFGGNGTFLGAIYAPQANFTLGGGGGNVLDFIGASVINTVKMNGHFNFHYDESLGRANWNRGYLVNSWNEI